MTRIVGRACALAVLVLELSAAWASAQDPSGAPRVAPQRRWSLEAAAGLQIRYRGDMESVAFGFAPTRSLTLLVNAERSYIRDKIERYAYGYFAERGRTQQLVSAEVRYAFFQRSRVSPYVLGGTGRGISRPNVSEFFPDKVERHIEVVCIGGGVRIPVHARFDALVDTRFVITGDEDAEMGVSFPVRAAIAWRF